MHVSIYFDLLSLDLVRSEDVIVFNDELSCLCYVMCVTPPLFACLFTSIIMN